MEFVISKISFELTAVESITSEIDKYPDVETGGVLLGFFEDKNIIIKKATDAGPKAIRERYDFKCDVAYTDMLIDMEFANSNGKIFYIGEWHTHPQRKPFPSETDLDSLDNLSSTNRTTSIALLFIVGFIDYKMKKFIDQSIAIIKYIDNEKYYKVEVEVL